MKTAHKIIISTLILFVLANCKSEICDLPKSDFVEKLLKVGINRNVFIKIENNHIYSNEIEIQDLKDLKYNFHRYTSLNDGSNRFTYIIQASKECSCNFIDSLFYQFSKYNMYRLFLQTNHINDSVGIKVHLPFTSKMEDKIVDSNFKSDNSIKIIKSNFLLNNKTYSVDLLQDKLLEIVKNKESLEIDVSKLKMYQDLITILDNYYIALYNYRRTITQYELNMYYDDLYEKDWRRLEIDNKVPNKLLIK